MKQTIKTPSCADIWSPPCDLRLPAAALAYREKNGLLTERHLGALNITVWLYLDPQGAEALQVNPNVTIAQLQWQFGAAETPDAEVGFHSEAMAAEWFRKNPKLRVLKIFTERFPCTMSCAPLLRRYYPTVPVYFYYRPSSWKNDRGGFIARAAAVLKSAYCLA